MFEMAELLSVTDSVFLHDRLHLHLGTAGPDDLVVTSLWQIHHGGAQPRVLAVTELASIKHETQVLVQLRELLHAEAGAHVAEVGGGEGQGRLEQGTHLSEERIVWYSHTDQISAGVEVIVEFIRSCEHQCHLQW